MTRAILQTELEEILGSDQVYFQRPESTKLKYPAIVYSLSDKVHEPADNKKYLLTNKYTVTVMSTRSTNTIADDILRHFQYSSFDRRFVNDNLYHDVITVFF